MPFPGGRGSGTLARAHPDARRAEPLGFQAGDRSRFSAIAKGPRAWHEM
jgi:hypothetical protein